jgi:hypothetical protein
VPGYPIRTPSDQRSVDSSPRTIAASHVLHRLLMPRHPPCALDNLTNTHIKKSRHKHATETKDARVHCTILNDHTDRHRTHPSRRASDRPSQRQQTTPTPQHGPGAGCPLRTQQCAARYTVPTGRRPGSFGVSTFLEQPPPTPERTRGGTGALHHRPRGAQNTRLWTPHRRRCSVKLLRKEVIQPHLPVRLPCYDFVPIASPTFDRSPPCGLGHGLRVLPTFVT